MIFNILKNDVRCKFSPFLSESYQFLTHNNIFNSNCSQGITKSKQADVDQITKQTLCNLYIFSFTWMSYNMLIYYLQYVL